MDSAYRDSGAVAAWQQQPMGFQTVLLLCGIHITGNTGVTLNLLCACVLAACGCRAVQTNSAETSLALLHM